VTSQSDELMKLLATRFRFIKKRSSVELLCKGRRLSLSSKRAWKSLSKEFLDSHDPEELVQLIIGGRVATSTINFSNRESRYSGYARELLATEWSRSRSEKLAEAVKASRCIEFDCGAQLLVETAALNNELFKLLSQPSQLSAVLDGMEMSWTAGTDTCDLISDQLIDFLNVDSKHHRVGTGSFEKDAPPHQIEAWLVKQWLENPLSEIANQSKKVISHRTYEDSVPSSVRLNQGVMGLVIRLLSKSSLDFETLDPNLTSLAWLNFPSLVEVVSERLSEAGEEMQYLISSAQPSLVTAVATTREFVKHEWLRNMIWAVEPKADPEILDRVWEAWFYDREECRLDILLHWGQPMTRSDSPTEPQIISYLLTDEFDVFSTEPKGQQVALLNKAVRIDYPGILNKLQFHVQGAPWSEFRKLLTDEVLSPTWHVGESSAADLCKVLGVVPEDEIERALFFLYTSQIENLLAFDPELENLSIGYIAAKESDRERLRPLLAQHPKLDIGRILSSVLRSDRLARLRSREVEYFAEQLIARGDSDLLWTLAAAHSTITFLWILLRVRALGPLVSMPNPSDPDLFKIVEATRENIESLRPELYELDKLSLLEFSNEFVEQLSSENSSFAVHLAKIKFNGRINDFSFNPRGRKLAVAGTNRVIGEIDLESGSLVRLYEGFSSSMGTVAYCGSEIIVGAERTNNAHKVCHVWACSAGSAPDQLFAGPGSITSLVRRGHGTIQFATRNRRLGVIELLESGACSVTNSLQLPMVQSERGYARAVAEDPPGDFNLWFGKSVTAMRNDDLTTVDQITASSKIRYAQWISERRVVGMGFAGDLHVFDVNPNSGQVEYKFEKSLTHKAVDFAAVPGTREIVVLTKGSIALFDVSKRGRRLGEVRSQDGTAVAVSSDGTLAAVGKRGEINIYDISARTLTSLTAKAHGLSAPIDVGSYQRVLQLVGPVRGQYLHGTLPFIAAKALLELGTYRFRHEIFIVDPVEIRRGEYDIVLGEAIEPSDQVEESG